LRLGLQLANRLFAKIFEQRHLTANEFKHILKDKQNLKSFQVSFLAIMLEVMASIYQ
jgi:hypothetical protein